MSLELVKLRNGCIALLTDEDLPDKIGSIEYFREQHYLHISYEKKSLEGRLLEQELPDEAITAIESALDSALIVHCGSGQSEGYYVPFTHIE